MSPPVYTGSAAVYSFGHASRKCLSLKR